MSAAPIHSLAIEHREAHGCPHVRGTCACGWASQGWYAGVAIPAKEYAAHVRNAEFVANLEESERQPNEVSE